MLGARGLILTGCTASALTLHGMHAAQAPAAFTEISLARAGCFFKCPVYSFTLRRLGPSSYVGTQYTPILGEYVTSVDSVTFKRLASRLIDLNMTRLDTVYATRQTDQRTTFSCFAAGSRRRCIRHYGDVGPPDLFAVEAAIDSVGSRLVWQPKRPHEVPPN